MDYIHITSIIKLYFEPYFMTQSPISGKNTIRVRINIWFFLDKYNLKILLNLVISHS